MRLYTLSLAVLFFSLLLPVGPLKVVIASFILLFYPGFLISRSLFQDHAKALLISPVVGASFWVVVFYLVSGLGLVRVEPVLIFSVVCAVFLDIEEKKKGEDRKRKNNRGLYTWLLPLAACMGFSSLYFYTWNTTLIPPLDDAKFYSFFVVAIENLHVLPQDYSMYAEIPRLTYPLGYPALVAVIKGLSGEDLFRSVTLSSWVLLLWTPVCFYVFSLPYGEKTAIFSAFSFSFLSIFFHRLEQTSTYPILLALEIFVLSLYVLRKTLEEFSFKKAVITSLLMAAAVETHAYAFLLYVPFLVGYGVYIFFSKNTSFKHVVVIILLAGVLLIPYGLRFHIHTPHEVELPYLRAWYTRDSLADVEKLSTAFASMSPFLILFSAISVPVLKRKDFIPLFLLVTFLIFPVLSIVGIDYPGWYAVSPNRVLNFTFIPLCIFSGIGIARVTSAAGEKNVLFILVIMALLVHFTDVIYPWGRIPDVSEINPPDDMEVIYFMRTLPPDAVILNFGMLYDPSGWIPSVAEREVFLSPFLSQRCDGCIYYLKGPEKVEDLLDYLENVDSLKACEFLEKYSIDYIFVPSKRECMGDRTILVDEFLNSPLYIMVYQKGESYLFKVNEVTCSPVLSIQIPI